MKGLYRRVGHMKSCRAYVSVKFYSGIFSVLIRFLVVCRSFFVVDNTVVAYIGSIKDY